MTTTLLTPPAAVTFERLDYDVNGTATAVLAAGDPAAPPVVFLHGAGTFHGWAFAEPWTERFRCSSLTTRASATRATSTGSTRCTTSCCTMSSCSTSWGSRATSTWWASRWAA